MLFNSFEFLIFFPVVTIIYFLLPHKFRWFHLLVASCIFYMAFIPVYILILFATIIIDYVMGIMIENSEGDKRHAFLVISVIANVGILAFFKYYNFFLGNINAVFHQDIPLLNIILPLGLSFHTFQAMSYTIEVYRGNQKAERHLGIYALYVMFYPQLVAGPIERPQNLLHQFHEEHPFDYNNVVSGLRLIMWGMLKKVVIADGLGEVANVIFGDLAHTSGVALFLGALFFIFQVYCDFSAYSDIALGSARVMGFKLMVNFNRPFMSRNIAEFWKRWHISLSTWFNDYVFYSISVSLRHWGKASIIAATAITFFLSGLWHGANWTFIVWGMLIGCGIIYEVLTRNIRLKIFGKMPVWLNNIIGRTCTFTFLLLAGVFFRAHTVHEGLFILSKIMSAPMEMVQVLRMKKIYFLHLPALYMVGRGLLLIASLEAAYWLADKFDIKNNFSSAPVYVRYAAYYAGPLIIYYFGVFERHEFIYFQF